MPIQSRHTQSRALAWLKTGRTLDSYLSAADAKSNGFDTIRLLAAASVIVSHSFSLTLGMNGFEPVRWLTGSRTSLGEIAVGIFFALSGMFITASFDRDRDVVRFSSKRIRRIIPGLFVAVTLVAVIMGSLMTNLPLTEYFTSSGTWGHFKNVLMLPTSYTLPGVFLDHTSNVANGSLWTLKFELACYAACVALMFFREKTKIFTVLAWIFSIITSIVISNFSNKIGVAHYIFTFCDLFMFFGFGMLSYLFKDRFIINRSLFLFSFSISFLGLILPNTTFFLAVFGSYSVICLGFLAPSWFRQVTNWGDISYGVYVYGWPVQQLMWPIGKDTSIHWLINSALSVPLAALLGAISWQLVEKPALAKRVVHKPTQPLQA